MAEARSISSQRYVQGTEIAPLVLPAATGGNPPLACTLVAVQERTRTLTPYGGLAPSEGGARGYRLGALPARPAFELGLEGERRESCTDRTEHGLMLRGRSQTFKDRPRDHRTKAIRSSRGRRSQAGGLPSLRASSSVRCHPHPSDTASECGI